MRALLFAVLMQAAAPPSPPHPEIVTGPEWIRRPTGEDMARFYPAEAQRREASGAATIACGVTAEGTLSDCTVVAEAPTGLGFGEAALKLSALFKMRSHTRAGQPVAGGAVRIPIRFVIDGHLDPLTAMLSCYGQTAAAAERDPDDAKANYAFGFFAAQVAIREADAKTTPAIFEQALSQSRQAALKGDEAARLGPSLSACMGLVPAH